MKGMKAELSKLTMREIKAIAKEEGICLGYDGARKDTAIAAIIANRRENGSR